MFLPNKLPSPNLKEEDFRPSTLVVAATGTSVLCVGTDGLTDFAIATAADTLLLEQAVLELELELELLVVAESIGALLYASYCRSFK